MEISTKEDAILIILKELDASHEKVIRMYFGLGKDPNSSIEEIGQDLDLTIDEVIELKNEGIREFIKLIVSTGIFGDKDKNFTDNFVQSSDSEFLDDFMKKFIGSNYSSRPPNTINEIKSDINHHEFNHTYNWRVLLHDVSISKLYQRYRKKN